MKKNLFFLSAAAIALASCSSEEVVEVNNGNAIDFRASMGAGALSRGQETTSANLERFYVTAIDEAGSPTKIYFENLLFERPEGVTSTESTTVFTSTTTYRWPGNDELKFYAFSYYGMPITATSSTDAASLPTALGTVDINGTNNQIRFTPNAAVKDQIDLVTAYATGSGSANDGTSVALNFRHALAQVEVQAKTGNTTYNFKVKGVKFANIGSEGIYTFPATADANGTWTLSTENTAKADYVVTYNDPISNDPISLGSEVKPLWNISNDGYPMLIPQRLTEWNKTAADIKGGAYIAVLLQITTKDTEMFVYPKSANTGENNSGYAWALIPVPANTVWEPGNRYVYTLDFSNGAGYDEEGNPILRGEIKMTTEVTAWSEVDKDVSMESPSPTTPATPENN